MNKKKHLIKDYKKRLEYKNKEIFRLKYLMIKNNNILPLNIRMLANDQLASSTYIEKNPSCTPGAASTALPKVRVKVQPEGISHSLLNLVNGRKISDRKIGERSKIRNRCIFTGRSRGIIKEWQISRIKFKLLADQGLIPGIRRASW